MVAEVAEVADPAAPDPADVAGSFALNTRKAYASSWRDWQAFAAAIGAQAVPAAPHVVADYVKRLAGAGASIATLNMRLAAISSVHRLAGLTFDRRAPALAYAMRRLTRELGAAPRNARDPLLTDDVLKLLPRGNALQDLRDRALILIAFAGAFRQEEVLNLEVADVAWQRDGLAITLRRSKTDQAGHGQIVGIRYGAKEASCPVRALRRWLAAAPLDQGGYAFRGIKAGRPTLDRLPPAALWRLVKRQAEAAGLDPERLGAHSLRAGHVTQALDNGADLARTQRQLRHRRVDTTLRYNRGADALRDNSSGKLGL